MSYENPWLYNDREVDDDNIPTGSVAFVYEITNNSTGRKYIGKKLLKFTKRKRVKRSLRRKVTKTDSDWKSYYGSNKELIDERDRLGADIFTRRILRFCESKGEANYYEAKFIFASDAILKDEYYNGWCSVKVSGSHISKKP